MTSGVAINTHESGSRSASAETDLLRCATKGIATVFRTIRSDVVIGSLLVALVAGCDPSIVLLDEIAATSCPEPQNAMAGDFELHSVEIPDTRSSGAHSFYRRVDGRFVVHSWPNEYHIDPSGAAQIEMPEARKARIVTHDVAADNVWSMHPNGEVFRNLESVGTVNLEAQTVITIVGRGEDAVVARFASLHHLLGDEQLIAFSSTAALIRDVETLPGGEVLVHRGSDVLVVSNSGVPITLPRSFGYLSHHIMGLTSHSSTRFCYLAASGDEKTCWQQGDTRWPARYVVPYGRGVIAANKFGEVVWTAPDETEESLASTVLTPHYIGLYRDGFALLSQDIDAQLANQRPRTNITLFWFARSECDQYTATKRPLTPGQ